MPFFDKNLEAKREEFRRSLMKRIKGAPRLKLPFRERLQLERKIFVNRAAEKISRDDYKAALRKMDRTKFNLRSDRERVNIERKVRFLKKLGGIKKLK